VCTATVLLYCYCTAAVLLHYCTTTIIADCYWLLYCCTTTATTTTTVLLLLHLADLCTIVDCYCVPTATVFLLLLCSHCYCVLTATVFLGVLATTVTVDSWGRSRSQFVWYILCGIFTPLMTLDISGEGGSGYY
jgi:hypothetical protein